jgi:hypothetical protein
MMTWTHSWHLKRSGVLTLAALLCLLLGALVPVAWAQDPELVQEPVSAVLVLETQATAAPVPARTFAAYLSADLAPYGLSAASLSVDVLPADGSGLDGWLAAHPECAQAPALAWLAQSSAPALDRQTDGPAQSDDILLLSVAIPQSRLVVQRQFPLVNGRPPAFAPLSAIAAAMIAGPLREQQAHLADEPAARGESPPSTESEQAPDFVPKRERVGESKPTTRLTLDAIPTFQSHLGSGDQFLGASLLLAYSPQAPLALLIGGGALTDITLSHARYRLSFLYAPLTAGGRFYKLFDAHALEVDAGILAQVGHLRFSDRLGVVPDTQVTRVNVGFLAALSYVYKPLPSLGVGLRTALGFTPRVQSFRVDDEPVVEPGAWFVQLGFILRWDALQ